MCEPRAGTETAIAGPFHRHPSNVRRYYLERVTGGMQARSLDAENHGRAQRGQRTVSLYVDSSALLKRYVDEPDSDACDAILHSDSALATGRHTVVEVRRNLAVSSRRASWPA